MMSSSTWDRVDFWTYLLNHNSLTHQIWSLNRHKQGEYFPEIFWIISKAGAEFQTFYDLATYVKYPVFKFFEWVINGELKIININ